MATYSFHGSSEFQAGITAATDDHGIQLQTLYLMNPNYVPYSSEPPNTATSMFFLNPATMPHAPPSNSNHNHFLGLPPTPPNSIGPSNSDDPNRPFSGVCHNLWGSSTSTIDHQQNSPPGSSNSRPPLVSAAATADYSGGPQDVESQLGFIRSPRQGLSLSLSSSQQVPSRSSNVETVMGGQPDVRPTTTSPSTTDSNGISGVQSVVIGSKYLRAAQELLDQVVNVGDISVEKKKVIKESVADHVTGEGSSAGENGDKAGPELTTAQRQELQMKKAKLVNMLDEVEQRYRQYHYQMQTVVVSFEQAAGLGAARSYTALALQTIFKQIRCLKDAISGQIKATSNSLGEEDCLGAKIEGSRLRYVNHQLRQQRTLQQLGMIQHNNAWRPQRGLPERAVCVLRAWLFEHFLHPYPKDSDKHMLAKQTGLTRSQVSNWFINARVRLWKPMVEEMYTEEVKGQQERNNGSEEEMNAKKSDEQNESGSSSSDQQPKPKSINHNINDNNTSSTIDEFSNSTTSLVQQTAFNLIGSSDLDAGAAQRSTKRPRNELQPISILPMEMDMKQGGETREMNMRFGDERLFKDSYSYLTTGTVYSSMRQMGRFDDEQQLPPGFHGNGGVSLTLGLPHSHSENFPLSGNHQNFVVSDQNMNDELVGASHSITYDNIEMQNRKRFAAPLLPNFVA